MQERYDVFSSVRNASDAPLEGLVVHVEELCQSFDARGATPRQWPYDSYIGRRRGFINDWTYYQPGDSLNPSCQPAFGRWKGYA